MVSQSEFQASTCTLLIVKKKSCVQGAIILCRAQNQENLEVALYWLAAKFQLQNRKSELQILTITIFLLPLREKFSHFCDCMGYSFNCCCVIKSQVKF